MLLYYNYIEMQLKTTFLIEKTALIKSNEIFPTMSIFYFTISLIILARLLHYDFLEESYGRVTQKILV